MKYVIKPLTDILTCYVRDGVHPTGYKKSLVFRIHKNRDDTHIGNYGATVNLYDSHYRKLDSVVMDCHYSNPVMDEF